MIGYDAAYGPKDLSLWKQHGAVVGNHYLTGPYATTSPQPDALHAEGLGVTLNWERMPGALVGASRAQGQAIGREAMAAAKAKGAPADGTLGIYFSVDVDVSSMSSCDDAFRGINDVLHGHYQVKVYGEGGLIDHLVAAKLVQGKQWLSMSEGFGGFLGALITGGNVGMVQMHDAAGNWVGTDLPATDRNTVIDPHALGAWWPAGSPYASEDDVSADDVWKYRITADKGASTPAEQRLLDIEHATNMIPGLAASVAKLAGQVAGLTKAVGSAPGGVDLAAVQAAAEAGADAALAGYSLQLTPPTE